VPERIRVLVDGTTLADTTRAYRVLETAGAPVYYVPPADVRSDLLAPTEHHSVCEWKGDASYWSIVLPDRTIPNAAWSYPDPMPGYEVIRETADFDHIWVGTETRDYQNKQWGGTPQYEGYFIMRWLGGIGGTAFTPIINAPEVAIMGVCKGYWKQHSPNGKTSNWRLTVPLSLSWDHRVIDGAAAARFNVYFANVLADLRRVLF
jgi:uncharacterized protein (DUF427 family)